MTVRRTCDAAPPSAGVDEAGPRNNERYPPTRRSNGWFRCAIRVLLVKRPERGVDGSGVVTGDLALLLTDDEALGHLTAEVILATDAALGASLYLLRCQDGSAPLP